MGEIILHPCDKNYCEECIYSNRDNGACNNEKYFKNMYKVNCEWKFCPYKKIKRMEGEESLMKKYL